MAFFLHIDYTAALSVMGVYLFREGVVVCILKRYHQKQTLKAKQDRFSSVYK